MKLKSFGTAFLFIALIAAPAVPQAAAITDNDSTQPRGAPTGVTNGRGQVLDPVIHGFKSPAFRAQFTLGDHFDWSGMLMGNSMRDPGFFTMHMSSIQDFSNFANTIPGDPADPNSPIYKFLAKLKLEKDITTRDDNGRLQPESKLPVTADICLRCHSPAGWMEGHSEPPTQYFPFLKGQFWAAALKEFPGWPNSPHLVRIGKESEAEMDGVQCDSCHRTYDNSRRRSLYDSSSIPGGNGGFFVDLMNIFGQGGADPAFPIQGKGRFCGTCHDVTNPLIKTQTVVNGSVANMLHPIERTYTEWHWSAYRTNGTACQDCHAPMKFLGAQTWNLMGMNKLWGAVDAHWVEAPFNYTWIPPDRKAAFNDARTRNVGFMRTAATVTVEGAPATVTPGSDVTFNVRIVNESGHKLPTGYGEGRQMWIHIQAKDQAGNVFFEDGALDADGKLVRTSETKVYEYVALAEGYENAVLDGFNILDTDKDGEVTHLEKEFRFILMNFIEKDNRIPPAGFNKDAFNADGAFIVPRDPKDTDYPTGQNWDLTPYTITIPQDVTGPVTITATLKYQTFSHEFIHELDARDHQLTRSNGGRARDIPTAGAYQEFSTWGAVNKAIWKDFNNGRPVVIGTAEAATTVQ